MKYNVIDEIEDFGKQVGRKMAKGKKDIMKKKKAWEGEVGMTGSISDCNGKSLCRVHHDCSFRIPLCALIVTAMISAAMILIICICRHSAKKKQKKKLSA